MIGTKATKNTPLLLFAGDRIEDTITTSQRLASVLRLCGILDEVLGRRALVSDLTEKNWLPFLQAVQCSKCSPETIRRARTALQFVWRQAVADGLVRVTDPKVTGFVNNVPSSAIDEEPPVPDGQTSLLKSCEEFFKLRVTIRSEKTRFLYRVAIRNFCDFLGRTATLDDLQDDLLAGLLGSLLDGGLAVDTVRGRVGVIKSLWTWLAKRHVVSRFPTITSPPAPDPLPKALSEEQIRRLFESAAKERGSIGGVPADLWWPSFLAFVWNTSERKGAVLAVRVEWLDLKNLSCTIPPDVRKGRRKWGVYEIWEETVPLLRAAINACPKRVLMWPWDKCEESYYTMYNRILREAGIPVNRKTKTHGLRCSHATWLKVAGGDPTQQLGHGDATTTQRHYLDPTKTRTKQPKLFIPWKTPEGGAV